MASSNPDAGLCRGCAFARVIASARGGRFTLCRRSETDTRFPRYPALPVLECAGYEKAAEGQGWGPDPQGDVTES